VTGTLIDLPGEITEINARLIRVDTGEVLSAGQAVVSRSWSDYPVAVRPTAVAALKTPTFEKVSTGAVAEEPEREPLRRRSNGKSLRLSNDNFPPDRRRPNSAPPRGPQMNGPVSTSFLGFLALESPSEAYMADPVGVPVIRTPLRWGHVGYNGTDSKPLPRTSLWPSRPLGKMHYERRTYSTPRKQSSQ